MNYGKHAIEERRKNIFNKRTMLKHEIAVHVFRLFLFLTIAAMTAGGIYIAGLYKSVVDDSPKITAGDVSPSGYRSYVRTKDGKKYGEFVASGANRVYRKLDKIPEDLQHAFIAIEDERFYEHNGIDVKGIARATMAIASSNGVQGASTITQQLIKNNVFEDFIEEKTFKEKLHRKIQEQYIAVQLEKRMTKDEILEDYLNTINLGQNTLGVQSASKRYFDKNVQDLTLSESAVIASITQNPGKYNPISHPTKNAERRERVLSKMLDQGYITSEQMTEALKDDVYKRIEDVNRKYEKKPEVNSYFMDALTEQVLTDLQNDLGYTKEQAFNTVYRGGITVTATIDKKIQRICNEEANNPANYPTGTTWGITSYVISIQRSNGKTENYDDYALKAFGRNVLGDPQPLLFASEAEAKQRINAFKDYIGIGRKDKITGEKASITPQPQSSIVVMDQKTGQVKAIVGGRGEKKENMSYDRATDAMRQPGSCFKVLAAYAPAIDKKGYNVCTYIKDEPFNYKDGTPVHNWWGDSYKGNVTVRQAIEQSMNVCAVKTITAVTPKLGYQYLKNFGITTLVKNEKRPGGIFTDIQQPLALGGITDGVKNIEITGAYATIANKGVYNKPIFYTKIVDHEGNILLDNRVGNSRRVLKESSAWLLTDAMRGVVTKGTGMGAALPNMPVSGKTGSTTDNKDIWFCGYTPYYTCGVWAGYDDNTALSNTGFHLTLWKAVMSRIHQDKPHKEFEKSNRVVRQTVCAQTGKLPSRGCPAVTDWIAKENAPSSYCGSSNSSGYSGYGNGGWPWNSRGNRW